MRHHTIEEVAERLGYPDRFAYAKQFKRVVGKPPGSRQKELRDWIFSITGLSIYVLFELHTALHGGKPLRRFLKTGCSYEFCHTCNPSGSLRGSLCAFNDRRPASGYFGGGVVCLVRCACLQ